MAQQNDVSFSLKNQPAMIFLPQTTEKELQAVLAVTKHGVAVSGSAAKTIGPLIGSIDISESDDGFLFRVALPGVKKDERNHLTGRIPEKIGALKELESFDLSLNNLSGELPMSLSSLNLLSSFNVSYNNLTGKIPSSTQLQSFNESCFVGNKLCGDPLSEPCSRVKKTPDTDHEEDDGSHGVDWGLIISVVSGFIAGFWVILAPLIVSRSWRIAYFRFLSELGYMAYDFTYKTFSR